MYPTLMHILSHPFTLFYGTQFWNIICEYNKSVIFSIVILLILNYKINGE